MNWYKTHLIFYAGVMLAKWTALKTRTSVSDDWARNVLSMKQHPGICFFVIGCKIYNITLGISRDIQTSPSILESSSDNQLGVLQESSFAKTAHGL